MRFIGHQDLSLNYCIREWLKMKVYKVKVNTKEELFYRIFEVSGSIKERTDKLRQAVCNFRTRVRRSIEVDGDFFK